ncbi:response regulator transcription factor [Adhaeribacter soli]|uniref:Response regulator transcription factor n=1 Tax=Adhaeribacter soli TaxID=2607655 RepID=A0A5N1J4N0_9BACT|nr:response regulator transcription factor [Adhaeribacter soli]KAA9345644.1 response regulator transcription factor [Adhaeribacter soli]
MTTPQPSNVKVVIADDHKLFRKGILELVNDFEGFTVVWEAEHGKDLVNKLSPENLPEIILLDISMPVMDGYQTAEWLTKHYPEIKVLALSMHNDDNSILRMLRCGVNGYILKNTDPSELEKALRTLETDGTYYSSRVAELAIKCLHHKKKEVHPDLSEREIEFLKLACTELPYKSFAPLLNIHPRVVESTRENLFKKLEVESRVGLVIYAIKNGIFKIE